MTRAEKLSSLADHWSDVFKSTRQYHALEKTKAIRTEALKAEGCGKKKRKRVRVH